MQIVSLAQDIIGAIKTAKLELLGNLVGNVGGGNGPLGLGLLRGLGGSSRDAIQQKFLVPESVPLPVPDHA